MREKKIKLSIVIVNYQSRRNLRRCLLSIRSKVNMDEKEVIIINNDQRESLCGTQKNFPEVKVFNMPENLGFGRAANYGSKKAKGDLVLFLNPDSQLRENIKKVFFEFKKNNDLGALGAKLVNQKGQTKKWSSGQEVTLFEVILNNLGIYRSRKIWKGRKIEEVFWVAGTALFVRRSIFLELGGFDENIFMYFEDVDFCRRLRIAGKKVVYFPLVSVFHLGGKSYQNRKLQKKHYYTSQKYYFKKNRPKWEFYLIRILGLALGK